VLRVRSWAASGCVTFVLRCSFPFVVNIWCMCVCLVTESWPRKYLVRAREHDLSQTKKNILKFLQLFCELRNYFYYYYWARDSLVDWGTMLEAGR
jgi:hypothetical protein